MTTGGQDTDAPPSSLTWNVFVERNRRFSLGVRPRHLPISIMIAMFPQVSSSSLSRMHTGIVDIQTSEASFYEKALSDLTADRR